MQLRATARAIQDVTRSGREQGIFAVKSMEAALAERETTHARMLQVATGEAVQELLRRHGLGPVMQAGGMIDFEIKEVQRNLNVDRDGAVEWIRLGIARQLNENGVAQH